MIARDRFEEGLAEDTFCGVHREVGWIKRPSTIELCTAWVSDRSQKSMVAVSTWIESLCVPWSHIDSFLNVLEY